VSLALEVQGLPALVFKLSDFSFHQTMNTIHSSTEWQREFSLPRRCLLTHEFSSRQPFSFFNFQFVTINLAYTDSSLIAVLKIGLL
jgi:hypothetical protein